MLLVLSENWTMMADGVDLPRLVRWAREAEDAGFDAVMVSEHIVLGPDASEHGLMSNPREYALPGNQDPATPWPSSLPLLSAIAAATTRIRLVAGAVLAPLRHPLMLAKELATVDLLSHGRLVVLPSVSWSRDEYAALGVPFGKRGRLLDEHLEVWRTAWGPSPALYRGDHYGFADVYCEPKPYRPGGPPLWFGGAELHDRLLARLVHYGQGFNPLGRPSSRDLDRLADGMAAAGRKIDELELVGGTRAVFADDLSPADLAQALDTIPAQQADGFTTFCIKPSQFTDDPDAVGAFCADVMRRVSSFG